MTAVHHLSRKATNSTQKILFERMSMASNLREQQNNNLKHLAFEAGFCTTPACHQMSQNYVKGQNKQDTY
jgi:hypothetical protein